MLVTQMGHARNSNRMWFFPEGSPSGKFPLFNLPALGPFIRRPFTGAEGRRMKGPRAGRTLARSIRPRGSWDPGPCSWLADSRAPITRRLGAAASPSQDGTPLPRQGAEGSPKASRLCRPKRSGVLEHPTREAGDAQEILRSFLVSGGKFAQTLGLEITGKYRPRNRPAIEIRPENEGLYPETRPQLSVKKLPDGV
jgi:hypothetical protein